MIRDRYFTPAEWDQLFTRVRTVGILYQITAEPERLLAYIGTLEERVKALEDALEISGKELTKRMWEVTHE